MASDALTNGVGRAMSDANPYLAVLVSIECAESQFQGWSTGPLPIRGVIPSDSGFTEIVATEDRRSSAFHRRVHRVLYPHPPDGFRMYRWMTHDESFEITDRLEVEAIELLLRPDELSPDVETDTFRGLVCLHIPLGEELSLRVIGQLYGELRQRDGRQRLGQRLAKWLSTLNLTDIDVDVTSAPYTVSFASLPITVEHVLPGVKGTELGNPLREWLWLLASLTPPQTLVPHDLQENIGTELPLSSTWSAVVQRDGAAFVATSTERDRDVIGSLRLYADNLSRCSHVGIASVIVVERIRRCVG